MAVLIKSFGNNTEVSSFTELMQALKEKYAQTSVSLVYTKINEGLKRVVFIDVNVNGDELEVMDSYIPEHPINLEALFV